MAETTAVVARRAWGLLFFPVTQVSINGGQTPAVNSGLLASSHSLGSAHIGIAAVSAVGGAIFLRTLSQLASSAGNLPADFRCSFHHEPLAHYLEAIHKNDWIRVSVLLKRSNELLARCGAKFCVTPDAAVQQVLELAGVGSAIPWVSMTDLVADQVSKDGHKRVAILGTDLVMNSSTFQIPLGLKGVQVQIPNPEDCHEVDRIIFEELLYGKVVPKSLAFASQLIAKLKYEKQCDAVILASSEAPLLVDKENSALPVYHAADLLASAAIVRAAAL